jgi:DNA topoisomerase-1
MANNLVIVESPAKAKTIEQYLGKDFTVLSSVGHIRSIAKKTKDGTPPIDVEHDFTTTYEVDVEKKKIIADLKKAVKVAKTVWLATDEDREGEAIAWHLCEVLRLDPTKTNRIVFHEITKTALEAAIKQPRTVDMHLVQAQQARQILDRIVGFELSPVVWQKVPGGKSAGRVQSPAVRLLVEREREIAAFEISYQFKITAIFSKDGEGFSAELPTRYDTEAQAHAFLESLVARQFSVANVTKVPGTRNPAAPFTTSTLQQEANAKLGYGSRATMSAAQKLYQAGKITYMRTDSVTLSGQAIAAATDYITKQFGSEYSLVRAFKTKSANAQEAHEAIRPTNMALEIASSDSGDQRIYELIRRRTLASQMTPARLERTTITIKIVKDGRTITEQFEAKGEVVVFDGFLKIYGRSKEDDTLPSVSDGDELALNKANARQVFARPPARYTEGSLVKKLEELGIGRPSTYATIIGTVQARGYAEKGENEGEPRDSIELELTGAAVQRNIVKENTGANKGKLVPTTSGQLISDFLTSYFEPIVDYGFTASVEKHFDDIAENKMARNSMLHDFYQPFHTLVEQSGAIERSAVAQAREVGIEPKSGKPILARFGRFGPLLQLGATEDQSEKPTFAPMPKGASVESVTLEQALKAFELPRLIGQTEDGQDIRANIGRFGPYVQVGKLFVSIKPHDPHEISLDTAIELYTAKLQSEIEKNIADFGDGVRVLKGRWGPYVTDGTKNARIDKKVDPHMLSHDDAKKLLASASTGKKRKFTKRTTKRT